MIDLTGASAKSGIAALQAIIKAASERLTNIPDDVSAIEALEAAAGDLGVPYMPVAELITAAIGLAIEFNRSWLPGSQLPPFAGGSGGRGSNPNSEG